MNISEISSALGGGFQEFSNAPSHSSDNFQVNDKQSLAASKIRSRSASVANAISKLNSDRFIANNDPVIDSAGFPVISSPSSISSHPSPSPSANSHEMLSPSSMGSHPSPSPSANSHEMLSPSSIGSHLVPSPSSSFHAAPNPSSVTGSDAVTGSKKKLRSTSVDSHPTSAIKNSPTLVRSHSTSGMHATSNPSASHAGSIPSSFSFHHSHAATDPNHMLNPSSFKSKKRWLTPIFTNDSLEISQNSSLASTNTQPTALNFSPPPTPKAYVRSEPHEMNDKGLEDADTEDSIALGKLILFVERQALEAIFPEKIKWRAIDLSQEEKDKAKEFQTRKFRAEANLTVGNPEFRTRFLPGREQRTATAGLRSLLVSVFQKMGRSCFAFSRIFCSDRDGTEPALFIKVNDLEGRVEGFIFAKESATIFFNDEHERTRFAMNNNLQFHEIKIKIPYPIKLEDPRFKVVCKYILRLKKDQPCGTLRMITQGGFFSRRRIIFKERNLVFWGRNRKLTVWGPRFWCCSTIETPNDVSVTIERKMDTVLLPNKNEDSQINKEISKSRLQIMEI